MKNTIIHRLPVLLAVPLLYCLLFSGFSAKTTSPSPPPPQGGNKDFINAVFNCGIEDTTNRNRWVTAQIDRYSDELKFNSIQIYDLINGSENGTADYGTFLADLDEETQVPNIISLKNMVYGENLKLYWERCKISKLCYGQRLVYEIYNGVPDNPQDINYGFTYQNVMQNVYTTDDGRTVLHPRPGINQAGDLCKNIYENLQHGDLTQFPLQYADAGTWFVKPMMRIDSNIVDQHPDWNVVRIDIYSFRDPNNSIKSVTIKARNFAHKNLVTGEYIYNGSYKDIYEFIEESPPVNLEISGDTTLNGNGLNDGVNWVNEWQWDNNCHVDFKVYWSGQVEVWFDKMTVDDFYANMLFNNSVVSDNIINDELSHTASMGFTYFIDEVTNSQIPCIKYVEDKITAYNQSHSTDAKIHFAGCNYNNWKTMKNNTIGYRMFFDSLQASSFNPDIHEFYSVPVPNVFSSVNNIISDWQVSPASYNIQLQNRMFGDRNSHVSESQFTGDPSQPTISGSLVYQLELTRQQANTYRPDMKMIVQPQIHSYCAVDSSGKYVYGQREPTTEEIRAQAMISIAHGADGLCWFVHQSSFWNWGNNGKWYMIGMLNENSPDKRTINWYGENKWDSVTAMNDLILKWKSTLDAITWQAGYSVHYDGASHNYISDIISIYRQPSAPFDFLPQNEDPVRYWEMGFFEDRLTAKYLIMVNRRCVPETAPGVGDIRELKIKFNGDNLPGFNIWNVVDVSSGQTVIRINKTSGLYYSLGSYRPAEGKLYKIVPVL